jgi:cobalt-precorrin-5B (C1)-methyltransferase
MSEQALIDSIKTELRMLSAIGYQSLLVSPGNYSTYFAKNNLKIDVENSVKCSNFVGETLDACVDLGFERILMLGHVGKFVKLAGGIMNTHSHYADCRMELLGMHAALQGAKPLLLHQSCRPRQRMMRWTI